MSRQLDWQEFWANDDRQRAVRRKLIDDLSIDPRAKEVLWALDELSQRKPHRTRRLPDGTVLLTIPLRDVESELDCTKNTAKNYLEAAVESGYLAKTNAKHCAQTYSIRWLAIVNRSQPSGETIPERVPVGTLDSRDERRGSTRGSETPSRGSIPSPTGGQSGGQSDSLRGSARGSIDPLLTPELTPSLKTSLHPRPVFHGLASKRPVLVGVKRGQFGTAFTQSRRFWDAWKECLRRCDLRNAWHVQALYEWCVELGCFVASERNRWNVFAQAAIDTLSATTPGAIFRENVPIARWYANTTADEIAERMMDAIERDIAEALDELPEDLPDEHAATRRRHPPPPTVQSEDEEEAGDEVDQEIVDGDLVEIGAEERAEKTDVLKAFQERRAARLNQ